MPALGSMQFERHSNSRKQGDAGLGIAIGWFARHGYTVSIPLTDSQPYDLIVDSPAGLQRVSVKTTTRRSARGIYTVGLRTIGANTRRTKMTPFDSGSAELLFVACDDGTTYLVPTKDVAASAHLCLGKKYQQYTCQ